MSYGREEDDVIDTTHRQLKAAEQLPPDLMLLKMENESIMTVARAQPRDPKKILKQLVELIDAYPEAADDAIYVKPVGTEIRVTCGGCAKEYSVPYVPKDGVNCPHCDCNRIKTQKKVKKFAEGLSIRAAESIRSIFGFNRLSVTMDTLPDGNVKLSGVFVDYATGTMTADTRVVSPYYTNRYKKAEKHPEDRFYNVIVKAEKSKLRRDVVLDSIPNVLKAAYRDACEKKLAALVSPEKIKNEILPNFAKKGLSAEHLEKIIGRPMSLGWTEQDRVKLRQIWTALVNEETTVAELLADLEEESPESTPSTPNAATNGGAKASDLTTPKSASPESTPPTSKTGAPSQGEQASSNADSNTDASQGSNASDDWAAFTSALAVAESLRDASAVGDYWVSKFSGDQRAESLRLIESRKQEIRSSRGSNSNQQKAAGAT
jgi:hypothetical protein